MSLLIGPISLQKETQCAQYVSCDNLSFRKRATHYRASFRKKSTFCKIKNQTKIIVSRDWPIIMGPLSAKILWVAKMHRMPYLYRSFSAQPYNYCIIIIMGPLSAQKKYSGWRRCTGCLIFTGHFSHSPRIIGSFAENDLRLFVSAFCEKWHATAQPYNYWLICGKRPPT